MKRIENVEKKQTSIEQQSDDKRNRWIDRRILDVCMQLIGRLFGGSDYDGYCWIAKEDLAKVYEKLSPATSIGEIINSHGTEDGNLEKIGFVGVRVFASFRADKHEEDYGLEISGTVTVPFVIFEEPSEADLLDGYSSERDPITIRVVSRRLQRLESANLNEDPPVVFKEPPETDVHFVRFSIGKQWLNEKAEMDQSLICDFCGSVEEGLASVEFTNGTFRLCSECCCQEFDLPECTPTEEECQRFFWQPFERHARRPAYEAAIAILPRTRREETNLTASENKAPHPQVSAASSDAEFAQAARSIDDPYFSVSVLPGGRGDQARQRELLGIAEDADQNDPVTA